jgi:mycothione reductase
MKSYDIVVIGAGDVGLGLAFKASAEGKKVALIDKGRVGGTCINYGCVPSKTLIQSADRIMEIREAEKLGIKATVTEIDFQAIMGRMRKAVAEGKKAIQEVIEETENLDFFPVEAHFINSSVIQVGQEKIKGKKIFIATGARPSIPTLPGLDAVPFLTNENVLELDKKPESLIVIGGGYVGLEYAHFFSALGTRVLLIHRHSSFLPNEEPEIAEVLKKSLAQKMELHLESDTLEVKPADHGIRVLIKDIPSGVQKEIFAEKLFLSTGRRSNADSLQVEKAGLSADQRHFITVDDTLQTDQKHIWALGDALGKAMFTHAGDQQAEIAWHNATQRKKRSMDFNRVPHAVFTYPQIASIGLTEVEARKNHEVLIGRALYSDTVMGEAMEEREGLAKAIVEKDTGKILGFHIIGPQASILIQEVVNTILNHGTVKDITGPMHIFPALSNLIPEVFSRLG